MKKIFYLLFTIVMVTSCSNHKELNVNSEFNVNVALSKALEKVRLSIDELPAADSLPRNVLDGGDEWTLVGIHDWTSGFWPGVLWYAYEASNDTMFLAEAEKFTAPLEGILDVPVDNHDLGFMLFCSYGNGYRLTHDEAYKKVIIRAADSLATLYNPVVGTILSWPAMVKKMNWPHNTIIDNMINLELLYWTSKNGGNREYFNMSTKHAEVTMKNHIRPDNTTYHVAVYDTIDGHFIKGVTHQGYSDNSMWARGQAWGIYGFTMCYRETGKDDFMKTAVKLANVYIKRLPEDGIPYWDFDAPSIPDAPKDASAAAVVASALLELSGYVKDKSLSRKYLQVATQTLIQLSGDKYQAPKDCPAILQHSTGHWPNHSEIDVPIIYADYYYMEALLRYKKMMKNKR